MNVDCKTVVFLPSKSVKKSVKRDVRVYARGAREPHTPSVFSLISDLLFDCSHVLEQAKIRTVLQSIMNAHKGGFTTSSG